MASLDVDVCVKSRWIRWSGSLTGSAQFPKYYQPRFLSTITRYSSVHRDGIYSAKRVNLTTKRNKGSLRGSQDLQDSTIRCSTYDSLLEGWQGNVLGNSLLYRSPVRGLCQRLAEADVVGPSGEIWPCQEQLYPRHHDFL